MIIRLRDIVHALSGKIEIRFGMVKNMYLWVSAIQGRNF